MWTWRHRLALTCCVSYLAIQVVVPFTRLARARPARFGWQMWSVRITFPRFLLVMADGTTMAPDLARYVATSRGEVDLRDALPPHLCRVVPELSAVEIRTPGSDRTVYPCR